MDSLSESIFFVRFVVLYLDCKINNMRKTLTLFMGVLFCNLAFSQYQKGDSISIEGSHIGLFQGSDSYSVVYLELHRDVTFPEWKILNSMFRDQIEAETGYSNYRISTIYNYSLPSRQQQAGHFLYEAGFKKNQVITLRLLSLGVGLATSLLSAKSESPAVAIIGGTISFSLSGAALIKEYRSNRMIQNSGATFQSSPQ
jgi:hypothetical protein